MNRNLIVQAIDVGHGNCKSTTKSCEDGFGLKIFPSIAPQSRTRNRTASGYFNAGSCFDVPVKDSIYTVGPDVEKEALTTTMRIVDSSFCLSDTYLALVRGCLTHLDKPHVDMLILGLPLTTYELHHVKLKENMRGGHKVFNQDRIKNPSAPEFKSVEVRNVRVFPQPVGAFFNYAIPRGLYEKMSKQTNLVIDVGLGTLDWYVAEGTDPLKGRCSANNNGVLSVSTSIADALGGDALNNFSVMNRIDVALRNKSSFKFNGKEININEPPFAGYVQSAIKASVASMMKSIGSVSDIDNIILTGGGANLFLDEIKNSLPNREIAVDTDPVYSVVKGFLAMGEKVAKDLYFK